MSKVQTAIVNLPFSGFYDSLYSGAIDHEAESFAEYRCDEYEKDNSDNEGYWPESLRLDESDYANILISVTNYRTCYDAIARDYVSAFDYVAGEILGFTVKAKRKTYNVATAGYIEEEYRLDSIRATFESMDSPREYNFTTDRVYANIPLAVMRALFKRSKAEKHATLSKVIAERFTSCDGFISGYPRHLADWLENPLQDWDHNEMATLLIAALRMAGFDCDESENRYRLYEATVGDEGAYQAWEKGVDWTRFEAMRAEKRAELLAAWIEEDTETAMLWRANHLADFSALVQAEPDLFSGFEESGNLPYRCPETPDLFSNL